jgi:AAA+ ATPase superfamily predicted ATPase
MNALTYSSLKGGRYTIVYGPRGIGKTELVDHTAIGKKGVVKVTVSSASSKPGVIQAITE